MIPRVFMTEERFLKELKEGKIIHKTYEEYKKAVNKVYDELEQNSDNEAQEAQDKSK